MNNDDLSITTGEAPEKQSSTFYFIWVLASALLLILSYSLAWLNKPLTGWLAGSDIPLLQNHISFLTLGLVVFLIGVLSLVSLFYRRSWFNFILGLCLFMLVFNFFFDVVLQNNSCLEELIKENEQYQQILSFDRFLPPNRGREVDFDPSITMGTISVNFLGTFHFASFGIYCILIAAVIQILLTASTLKNRRLFSILSLFILWIIIGLFFFKAHSHFFLEQFLEDALIAAQDGRIKDADEYILKATALPSAQKRSSFFHKRLGEICYLLNRVEKSDYFYHLGLLHAAKNEHKLAIFNFEKALGDADRHFSMIIGNEIAGVYIENAFLSYRKGLFSEAVELWEKALEVSSEQYQCHYFLCRAYYDLGSYEKSIEAGEIFLHFCRNKLIKADTASNIGDSYYKWGDVEKARMYYLLSYNLDKDENVRAIMSLSGK